MPQLRVALPIMAQPRSGSGSWRVDHRSDTELLVDACRDPEAFGEYYTRNVRSMITYFWSRTRDHDVTSDLVAETFAAALAGVERYDPAKGNPRQWLYGIANNQLKGCGAARESRRMHDNGFNCKRRPPQPQAGKKSRLPTHDLTPTGSLRHWPGCRQRVVKLSVCESSNNSTTQP